MGLLRKAESRKAPHEPGNVETDIDRLYTLALERAPLKLSKAAEILGKPKDIVEDWARTLEAAGLLKLHYPPVGEPELVQ